MTDDEIVAKFNRMASNHMGEGHVGKLIKTVFELESLDDIVKLNRMMAFTS